MPAQFYLLTLSKKNVEVFPLYRSSRRTLETARRPSGNTGRSIGLSSLPITILKTARPLVRSTGAMHGVRFGTGSGRETQSTYLADFYKAVDRGVRELLGAGDVPLVLAGVGEETDLYRTINHYPNLLAASVQGSQTNR